MKKTPAQIQAFLNEACDTRRTALVCGKHNYSPGGPKFPAPNCSDCWFAFLFHHFAKLPPDLRAQKLEELTEVIHHTAESVERGEFDFEPYRHPKIKIEKNAEN